LSIADLLIQSESNDLEALQIDLAQWPNFKAWYTRITENPAVAPIYAKAKEAIPQLMGMFVNLEYIE